METIYIHYVRIKKWGVVDIYHYHKYAVYTNSAGQQFAARGGEYGDKLVTQHGVYDSSFIDHPLHPTRQAQGNKYGEPELIAQAGDLSSYWQDIKDYMDHIEESQTEYDYLDNNSNTAIDSAIGASGLLLPSNDGYGGYPSPGSGIGSYLGGPGGNGVSIGAGTPNPLFDPFFDHPAASPIVIDFDKDGKIELSPLTSGSTAFFDLDEDGFAEQTGWVKPDDGLLARDWNSDGIINDNGELFGSATTDGFTELQALDSNSDDIINSSDSEYANLLLWRDLDGDGYSDAGELQSLSSAGIASINLNYFSVLDLYNQGHEVSSISNVTFSDSSTATIQDIWFQHKQSNSYYTEHDNFSYDADVFELPQVPGAGNILDLWMAMSQDSGLKTLVTALATDNYSSFSFSDFHGAVEDIVFEWFDVTGVNPTSRGPYIDARILEGIEKYVGREYTQTLNSTTGQQLENLWEEFIDYTAAQMLFQIPELPVIAAMRDGLSALELEPDVELMTDEEINDFLHTYVDGASSSIQSHPLYFLTEIGYSEDIKGLSGDFSAFIDDIEAVDPGGVGQQAYWDDLLPLINAVAYGLNLSNSVYNSALAGSYLDTQTVESTARWRCGNEIIGTSGNDNITNGAIGQLANDYIRLGLGNDKIDTRYGADVVVYNLGDGNDTIQSNEDAQDDTIIFGSGITLANIDFVSYVNDALITLSDSAVLRLEHQFTGDSKRIERWEFTQTGEVLSWQEVKAIITDVSTSGNDSITGFNDEDTLSGGLGNDTLRGLEGSDTFIYNLGDGNDTISVWGDADSDRLVLNNITLSGITLGRNGEDAIVNIAGGGSIKIEHMYDEGLERIESIEFSDGSFLAWQQIWQLMLDTASTSGNDTIIGYYTGDTITGLAGHDSIYGDDGNDSLLGGDGNDLINGQADNDTMVGGTGNDTFIVYEVADILVEAVNEGVDVVQAHVSYTLSANVDNLTLMNSSNIHGTGNAINNYIVGNSGQNSVSGADGDDTLDGGSSNDTIDGGNGFDRADYSGSSTSWTFDLVNGTAVRSGQTDNLISIEGIVGSSVADTMTGSAVANYFSGGNGNDSISSAAGDDSLYGGAGADTVIGGSGADYLQGDAGNDVFRFLGLNDSSNTAFDHIQDFVKGQDKINLSGLGFTGIASGSASGTVLGYTSGSGVTDIWNAAGTFHIEVQGTIAFAASDFTF